MQCSPSSRYPNENVVGAPGALRERLQKVSDLASVQRAPTGTATNDEARLIGALTNMGYRLPDAQRAVRALGDRVGKDALADLLRDALATLAT